MGARCAAAPSSYALRIAPQQEDRHVVGQLAAVQLPDLGDRRLQQFVSRQPLFQPAVDHRRHAVLAQPLTAAGAHASLDEPVRVQHQAPGAAQLHLPARPPGPGEQPQRRAAVLVREESGGPAVAGQQRCRVPGQAESRLTSVGSDVDRAERREDLLALPLVLQHLLEGGEQIVPAQPGQGQRPPGDPQLDAERGLVRAVAADVADHRVHRAVRGADDVVEVAAEQGAAAAGAVAGGEAQPGAVQQRGGEQPAFQPGVLLGAQPGFGELVLGDVGAFALHRVPDGAAQDPRVQLAPEEVVLRPDAYGLGGQLRVVLRGQRENRVVRGETEYVGEGGQLVGPRGELLLLGAGRRLGPRAGPGVCHRTVARAGGRQGEVQEDAVDVVGEQPRGLGEVAGGTDTDPGPGRCRELGDGDGGARRVVLDHQQGEIAVRGLRSGSGTLLRYGYGHRFGFPSLPPRARRVADRRSASRGR